MKDLTIFVKLNASATAVHPAIGFVEESYRTQCEHFYFTSDTDTQTVRELLETVSSEALVGRIVTFIQYRKNAEQEVLIQKLYLGKILRLEQERNSYQIFYTITNEVTSPLVIDNFMRYSTLNIARDFEEDSHISIENSSALNAQLQYMLRCPCDMVYHAPVYPQLSSEDGLSEFAQRNEYCRRFFNVLPPSATRSEYQRDYDRIVHSKAFRRMVDKAQIFTSAKGDHYRTRMTHTLCVTQIARSIASRISMNVPLSEAIALGHDLGHTPFGHQGERTLDKMARHYAGIGFKHNFQSLRVATILEEEYIECSGLDLSLQVLEGMWKHTKIRKKPSASPICDVGDFVPYSVQEGAAQRLHAEEDFCSTVEGQIVFIADEIAQRSHDLDGALSAGLLSVENLLETLSLKKLRTFRQQIVDIQERMQSSREAQRVYVSEKELLNSRIASQVISYFIDDIVKTFSEFLNRAGGDIEAIRSYFAEHKCVDRQLLYFSEEAQALNDYLETIVTRQVINSPEVAAFDDKAKRVVTKLFELYYDNPRLLHDGTLQRIFVEMRKRTDHVIHFQDGDIALTSDEWDRIKYPDQAERLRDLREQFPDIDLTQYSGFEEFANQRLPESPECEIIAAYRATCRKEYLEKRRVLVRAICDFISGMTDTYALNEYRKLTC